ncbi:MAG: hypothetical protein LBT52_05160 [Clostridiales Family XIII bacterium]|nr:hypothetical protein [Clostridiales Family XIII bacterium]
MSSASMKKRLIILIVIVVALAVAILLAVYMNGDSPGGASGTQTNEIQNDGLVIEDTATVEVDIDEDEESSKKDKED